MSRTGGSATGLLVMTNAVGALPPVGYLERRNNVRTTNYPHCCQQPDAAFRSWFCAAFHVASISQVRPLARWCTNVPDESIRLLWFLVLRRVCVHRCGPHFWAGCYLDDSHRNDLVHFRNYRQAEIPEADGKERRTKRSSERGFAPSLSFHV